MTDVWFLPGHETPFLNRTHPVFLAIKDRVVDYEEGRIRLQHFGWVSPASCCKNRTEAEEELFHLYEECWLDKGILKPPRSTLQSYYQHCGRVLPTLPWFDLHNLLSEDHDATS